MISVFSQCSITSLWWFVYVLVYREGLNDSYVFERR